jgi:flavin-dependent dehydrogenase
LSAVEVFFDKSLAPGFIGWIIPVNEEIAKIGLGVSRKGDLPYAKKKFLGHLNLSCKKPHSHFSALIPLCVRSKTAGIFDSHGKEIIGKLKENSYSNFLVALCGDAAGQVKASSGGGIFFGASCGRLAGKFAFRPHEYERAWRHEYGADLIAHRLLRSTLDVLPNWGLDAWMAGMRHARLDQWLMRVGEMDQYSKMLKPSVILEYAKLWLQDS